MFTSKHLGVIYLNKNSFSYYNGSADAITQPFPDGSIKELEVANEELFLKEGDTFFVESKLKPASVVIIIAPELLYEKEIHDTPQPEPVKETKPAHEEKGKSSTPAEAKPPVPKVSPEEVARQIQLFLDIVPYEETGSKVYKIEKGVKVIATNKTLYELIKILFTKHGFTVVAVVPATMLPKEVAFDGTMSEAVAKKIVSKFESVKQHTLIEQTAQTIMNEVDPSSKPGIQMSTKVQSKREYALIGVFVVLMVILGVVSYTTFFATPEPKKVASISQAPVVPSPTVMLTPTPDASASAALQPQDIRIQVVGGTVLQSDLLRQQLVNSGFTSVTTRPNSTPASGKTLVIFSNTLPQPARELTLTELQKHLLNITVQENNIPGADAIVNL